VTTTVFCRDNLWQPAKASTSGTNATGSSSSAVSFVASGYGSVLATANPANGLASAASYYPQYTWGSAANQNFLGAQEIVSGTSVQRPAIANAAIYSLSGTVQVNGSALDYSTMNICIYWKPTGALVAICGSDGSGNWTTPSRLVNYTGSVYYVICRDDNNTTYNGQIFDNLTAG